MSKHPLYNDTGLQKDNRAHVLYALANKQIKLRQIQDEYETKISKIKKDLSALETTICLFDDDCDKTIEKLNKRASRTIKRVRNSYFERGEAKKVILSILRGGGELTTEEIAKKAMISQGLTQDSHSHLVNVTKTVLNTLRRLEKDNIILNSSNSGRMLLWKIKR